MAVAISIHAVSAGLIGVMFSGTSSQFASGTTGESWPAKNENPRVHGSKREGIGNELWCKLLAALPGTFDHAPQHLWERGIISWIRIRDAKSRHDWLMIA